MPSLERHTLLKAAIINSSMLLVLRFSGTRQAVTLVNRWSAQRFAARRQRHSAEVADLARRIGSSVNRAAADPAPAVTCLARSLTAQLLLRRRGIDAALCIGVGRVADTSGVDPGGLAFHAWVEVDGIPVNDAIDVAQRFVPFPLEKLDLFARSQV